MQLFGLCVISMWWCEILELHTVFSCLVGAGNWIKTSGRQSVLFTRSQCPIIGFYCLCFLIFMVWLVKSCTVESQAKKALFEKLTHSVFCRNIYLNHVFPCVLQYHTMPSDLIAIHGSYLLFLWIDLNLTGKKAAINILGDPRKAWDIRYIFPKYNREKH